LKVLTRINRITQNKSRVRIPKITGLSIALKKIVFIAFYYLKIKDSVF